MRASQSSAPPLRLSIVPIVLLLIAALASFTAHAEDWRYRVRPGDTVWDLTAKYLRGDIAWQRLQAHNQVANPRQLPPGSTMRFPVRWLKQQPANARVLAVEGEAQADIPQKTGAPQRVAVTPDMQLGMGTRLQTSALASVSLEFADGSRLLLHGDSELTLDLMRAYGATGMADTRLRLSRGRIGNTVKKMQGPASRFVVEAPGSMSSVRGTEFRIASDATRSQAEVLEGSVSVQADRGRHLLKAGQGAASDKPEATPLLPAPDASSIKLHSGRLTWAPVPEARSYRLEVGRAEIGKPSEFLALAANVVSDTPAADLPTLANGSYPLRVRAIDASGIEGKDALGEVRITVQPPFAISPADQSTSSAARPRFRWTATENAASYRFQLAGEDGFARPLFERDAITGTELRLPEDLAPGAYRWRLATLDADGQASAFGDAMQLTVAAAGGPAIEGDAGKDGLTTLRWSAGEPGQRYQFQLSRKPDFSKLEIDQQLDSNQIALPKLRSGTWHARTRTIDSDGYAGEFGPTQTLELGCRPCRMGVIAGGILLLLAL